MAISVVQSASSGTGSTASTVTVTLGSPTTAGNCLVVAIATGTSSQTVSGITLGGSAGNFAQATGFSTDAEIWTDQNCAGGQTSIVVTMTGSTNFGAFAYEVSGLLTSGAVDAPTASGNGGSGTSWSSGASLTGTAQASEIYFGVVGYNNSVTITGPSAPWVNGTAVTGSAIYAVMAGYNLSSSLGDKPAYAGTATGASNYLAAIVTLKAAPPGGGPTTIAPGPTWLATFKPYLPRRRPPVVPSGPDPGTLPNRSDMPAVRPGPVWARHFKPGLQRPIMPPEGDAFSPARGQSVLGLTTAATVVQRSSSTASLGLTTSCTPRVLVPGTGSSHLGLTSGSTGDVEGFGISHLRLTTSATGASLSHGASALKLTATCTPRVLYKTLLVSIASQAGTDQYGNQYVQGLGVYGFGELVSPVIIVNSNAGGFFVEAS